MSRDWMRDERRDRWDERRDRPTPSAREDYGLADFSSDYGYDPDRRTGYPAEPGRGRSAEAGGPAAYSTDYAYHPTRGPADRRFAQDERGRNDARDDRYDRDRGPGEHGRSWVTRAGAFFSGRDEGEPARRRRGPSDRVLWAVIVERLEAERGLDLRDVEVLVEDAEVTLNGTVRRKEDKRRIEDVADLDGVGHVQNNLRVRERRWF